MTRGTAEPPPRTRDQMNSIFLPDRVAQTVEEMKSVLEPELAHHFARWGGDLENWNRNLREQALYAVERPLHLRQLRTRLTLPSLALAGPRTVLPSVPNSFGRCCNPSVKTAATDGRMKGPAWRYQRRFVHAANRSSSR